MKSEAEERGLGWEQERSISEAYCRWWWKGQVRLAVDMSSELPGMSRVRVQFKTFEIIMKVRWEIYRDNDRGFYN